MKKQDQSAGDSSTNIQAGGNVIIHHGVTVSEAIQLAENVFKSNFMQLAGEAKVIAERRAEEVARAFFTKLEKENPDGIQQATDPDFQHCLYVVQQEYTRCGDEELGDLLVDLLVDRTKHSTRTILQIVLNESLGVAPKLTSDQLGVLSITFVLRYTVNHGINSLESLLEYLDCYIEPFVPYLKKSQTCYQHLEYSGCGAIGVGQSSLEDGFVRKYPGVFSKGFTEEEFNEKKLSISIEHPLITRCLHDPNRFQVNAMNKEVVDSEATKHELSQDDILKITSLVEGNLMNKDEVEKFLVEARPYMKNLFEVWKEYISHFTLTSVGIAIGHANIKKTIGEFTDLSIWIN